MRGILKTKVQLNMSQLGSEARCQDQIRVLKGINLAMSDSILTEINLKTLLFGFEELHQDQTLVKIALIWL